MGVVVGLMMIYVVGVVVGLMMIYVVGVVVGLMMIYVVAVVVVVFDQWLQLYEGQRGVPRRVELECVVLFVLLLNIYIRL